MVVCWAENVTAGRKCMEVCWTWNIIAGISIHCATTCLLYFGRVYIYVNNSICNNNYESKIMAAQDQALRTKYHVTSTSSTGNRTLHKET
jgi:hypothetical protein